MSIDPTEIHLTPEQLSAIAFYAQREGKTCSELIDEHFPVFPEMNQEDMEESVAKIEQANQSIDEGKGRDLEEGMLEIASKHGLNIQQ